MATLQQLQYFRELAKTEHLTQTAEALCIAQTTLSNMIIRLEKQLGVQLFDRTGRKMILNEAGKIYLSHVNTALNALENAEKAVAEYADMPAAPVTVAMTSSHVWQDLINGYKSVYPEYSIRQSDCSRDSFRMLLTQQQTDFVLAGTRDFQDAGMEHDVLYTDDIYLCVPKGHPLSEKKSIHLADAAGETFIDLPKSSSFRHFCDRMFQKAGINHRTEVECDYMLRGQLVEAGFGVALMTNLSYWQKMLSRDVVYIPVSDDFAVREFSIFWNPKNYLSKPARDFRQFAVEMYRKQEKN